MDRRKFSMSMLAAAVAGLSGCGGGGTYPIGATQPDAPAGPVVPPAIGPELATATSLPASTVFLQTLAATDGDGERAPGQANAFDLNQYFGLEEAGDDQFDGVLAVSIDVGGGAIGFPSDQTYAELTALGPELTAADGVKSVTFANAPWAISGACSAVFHPGPDVRLQQTLNLASAAGHAVDLTWTGQSNPATFQFSDEPYYLQVVVRDTAGTLLATLYRQDDTGTSGTWGTASLTAFAGQTVVLSFEQRSSYSTYGSSVSVIDDVSVVDTVTSTQYVTNGDFEAGATGWTVPAVRVSQNVRSGARTLPGVGTLERTFYTQPNVLWGRMTDTFTNTSGAPVTATIAYSHELGSDGAGILYSTPGTSGKAVTGWDGSASDRDVGFVFGAATTVSFTSATALATYDGSDVIQTTYDVTVPAGASVTIINFVILVGGDTGQTAVDATARATEVDTIAADIANNFRTNFAYQRGLTQAQLDTLKNF